MENLKVFGSGKRKTSISSCVLQQNHSNIFLKNHELIENNDILERFNKILNLVQNDYKFSANFSVSGGGVMSQIDAMCFSLSDAIMSFMTKLKIDTTEIKHHLRRLGYIQIDSRIKESKKPGQPKARRKRQFSKR